MRGSLSSKSTSHEEIFVQSGILQTRVARMVDERLVEIFIYPSQDFSDKGGFQSLMGGIFVGQVVRAARQVDAVFVDILPHVTGFLATRHTDQTVHEGERMLVRVIGEARGDKGPQLSTRGLSAEWAAQKKNIREIKPRTRIDTPINLEAQIVRDLVSEKTLNVWFDTAIGLSRARGYAGKRAPEVLSVLRLACEGLMFDVQEFDAEIDAALSPRVSLTCGGWITIESTEGFTAIDVNSGGFASSNAAETAFEVNRQAVEEIAAQVRLRSIGGLIVIDFIQMKAKNHRVKLEAIFKQTLKADPMSCQTAPLSPFGVIEMTRRRGRASLESQLTEPTTASRRHLRFAELADRLARALEREAAGAPGLPVEIQLSAALGEWLSAHPEVQRALESQVAAQVEINVLEHWPRTRFEVHVRR